MMCTSDRTVSTSMHHSKVHNPPKFREITGVRAKAVPPHDHDDALAGALESAVHKTNLGVRMWLGLIRDYPKVRGDYSGAELAEYDGRRREIYAMLKHRQGRYMAQFALYLLKHCETLARTYVKRRAADANAARPRCSNPALMQGAGSCVLVARGLWVKLADAPKHAVELLAAPHVILRFPVVPYHHTTEFRLNGRMVEDIATARRVGAVTVTPTALSVAVEPMPPTAGRAAGCIAMDINKREHAIADTAGRQERVQNVALVHAEARRRKHTALGVTGGQAPKKRNGQRAGGRRLARHPGRKPSNKGKRRDWRVNRLERKAINTRYTNQKMDFLYKMMHGLAARGMDLVLERPTIDAVLVRSNGNMSSTERDLLKMGLSQGTVVEVARRVFAKHGLRVHLVDPWGTSSDCPVCGERFWEARYKDKKLWRQWRRKKACTRCLYLIDRDDAAPINMLRRRLLSSDGEPVAGSGDGPRVAGDWEQWVDGLVNQLVGTACVRFPRVYGEGRRLKGSAKKPYPGRTRVFLTTAQMHPSATRRGLRAVYVSDTPSAKFAPTG